MLFNSWTFAAFLALVLPAYYLASHRAQNRLLLVASYVFYGWWDWRFLSLLWLSTVVDFFVARAMDASQNPVRRRRLMQLSVTLNLCYLGFFKYFNFFTDSTTTLLHRLGWHPDFVTLHVLLPVGISFYTFQAISYIVDVYRNSREHTDDFVAFALYLSYFPHLVAGPIQRSTQLLPQLLEPRTIRREQVLTGLQLMLVGYFKKVAIADAVAIPVNSIFADPAAVSWITLVAGAYLFAIQIYCDFSGYTDIARGVSRLMGIELRINFRQPYLSTNITDFWRRWHISLSDWLRDYLYISLGGNRKGNLRTYLNLMITMLLGGLWHGAAWTFVIWGGMHGAYLAIHKAWMSRSTEGATRGGFLGKAVGVFVTFNLVCVAWIFFRAPRLSAALHYLHGIATLQHGVLGVLWLLQLAIYFPVILCLDWMAWSRRNEQPFAPSLSPLIRGLAMGAMVATCIWIGSTRANAFIYFQF